jgi:hypothetical protein
MSFSVDSSAFGNVPIELTLARVVFAGARVLIPRGWNLGLIAEFLFGGRANWRFHQCECEHKKTSSMDSKFLQIGGGL